MANSEDSIQVSSSRKIADHLGQRIVQCREQRGWNRNVLARRSGLGYSHLRYLEEGRGEPTVSTVLALVRAFGLCSIEELLGGPLGTRILLELEESGEAGGPHPQPL